jgi:hypothetical protein
MWMQFICLPDNTVHAAIPVIGKFAKENKFRFTPP